MQMTAAALLLHWLMKESANSSTALSGQCSRLDSCVTYISHSQTTKECLVNEYVSCSVQNATCYGEDTFYFTFIPIHCRLNTTCVVSTVVVLCSNVYSPSSFVSVPYLIANDWALITPYNHFDDPFIIIPSNIYPSLSCSSLANGEFSHRLQCSITIATADVGEKVRKKFFAHVDEGACREKCTTLSLSLSFFWMHPSSRKKDDYLSLTTPLLISTFYLIFLFQLCVSSSLTS